MDIDCKVSLNNMRISHSGILMILGSYYPEITGGVTQSHSLIKTLKEKFKFMVLVTMRNMALPRRERVEGADVFRIPLRNGSRIDYFNAIFRFISFSLQYRNNIRIVHMHGFTIKSRCLFLYRNSLSSNVKNDAPSFSLILGSGLILLASIVI